VSKKALKRGLFTGIITTVLLVGCQNAKPAETITPQLNNPTIVNETQQGIDDFSETKFQKDNTDRGYKMLYGEWLVEKKIGENRRLDIEDVSDVIGETFMFSRQRAVYSGCNKEIEIDYPEYEITIIPLDEQTTYFPYMPTLNEMGITGSYVTIFHVDGGGDIYFILKDDETVIMFYKEAYLELRRIGHIELYHSYYRAV